MCLLSFSIAPFFIHTDCFPRLFSVGCLPSLLPFLFLLHFFLSYAKGNSHFRALLHSDWNGNFTFPAPTGFRARGDFHFRCQLHKEQVATFTFDANCIRNKWQLSLSMPIAFGASGNFHFRSRLHSGQEATFTFDPYCIRGKGEFTFSENLVRNVA